jgi:putative DNA primase/helicase
MTAASRDYSDQIEEIIDEPFSNRHRSTKPGAASAYGEDGIALDFAEQHTDLRHVAAWHRWMLWNGTCWSHENTTLAFDRARALCRAAAEKTNDKTIAKARTVAAVVTMALADRRMAATTEQWDTDAMLLTAGAATIDLRTGVSHKADPLDYITKKAACSIAPAGTPHPIWTAFLDRITDSNQELQQFLQRYVGYCCTGDTAEHVFVFAHGTGANGKSTFTNTIGGILGNYATIADMATFIASNAQQHPTDLAKLMGARLVIAQETQKGRRWDETKIKALTGGDKIAARFMRQDFFDFTPTFKLFICGNHKPQLSSVDEAMRRRLLLVPFTVQIPPAERDPQLTDKLKVEWAAILRWMVEGCIEWQRIGLKPPATVLDATEEYFAEQDTLQQWLDECTEDGGSFAFSRTAELFASWKAWCEARNMKSGSEKALSTALRDKGFVKSRNHAGQTGFRNLVVKA